MLAFSVHFCMVNAHKADLKTLVHVRHRVLVFHEAMFLLSTYEFSRKCLYENLVKVLETMKMFSVNFVLTLASDIYRFHLDNLQTIYATD